MAAPQSVTRSLRILRCFSLERSAWSLNDLSAATSLPKPTAHRHLQALVSEEFLTYNPASKLYSLGASGLRLAQAVLQAGEHRGLSSVAAPHLEALREATGETTALHRRMAQQRVLVVEMESPQPMRIVLGAGRVRPLYTGAAGLAMLSILDNDEFAEVCETASQDDGEVDVGHLEVARAEVEARGYAVSAGTSVPGASAIAVAFRHAVSGVVAALSITGPSNRWTTSAMAEVSFDLVSRGRMVAIEWSETSGSVRMLGTGVELRMPVGGDGQGKPTDRSSPNS